MKLEMATIRNWISLDSQLKRVKVMEMQARKDICFHVMGGAQVVGTKHFSDGAVECTATAGENLSVSQEDLDSIASTMNEQERKSIKWKPSIVKKEYDKLPMDSDLRRIVKLTIGTPSLKVTDLEL